MKGIQRAKPYHRVHRGKSTECTEKQLTLGDGMLCASGAGFGPQGCEKLVGWQGINDVGFLQPAAARHGHAVVDEWKMQSVMGVGGNDHFHASLFAHALVHV